MTVLVDDGHNGFVCAECRAQVWVDEDPGVQTPDGVLCKNCIEETPVVEVVDLQTRRRYREQPKFDTGQAA